MQLPFSQFSSRSIFRHIQHNRAKTEAADTGLELPLSADCVEKIGSCRGTAAVIQSGPGDWSAADDGGTSERAGRSVLRVFARASCASGASTAIDRPVCRTRWATVRAGAILQREGAAFD